MSEGVKRLAILINQSLTLSYELVMWLWRRKM